MLGERLILQRGLYLGPEEGVQRTPKGSDARKEPRRGELSLLAHLPRRESSARLRARAFCWPHRCGQGGERGERNAGAATKLERAKSETARQGAPGGRGGKLLLRWFCKSARRAHFKASRGAQSKAPPHRTKLEPATCVEGGAFGACLGPIC